MTNINRRALLAGTAVAAGAACLASVSWLAGRPAGLAAGVAREVAFAGHLYRGTDDGRILRSRDDGRTWEVNDDFGPDHPVTELGLCDDGLFAQLAIRGRDFRIRSGDATRWYT